MNGTRQLLALALLALSGAVQAAGVGDTLPELALKDAADVVHTLDDAVHRIYYSGDRDSGGLLKETAPAQAQLDAQHAVAIANVSDAPGFVKFMIRKSLKGRAYVTWMDESGVTKPLFPVRPGQVTIIDLQRRKITAVRYAGSVEALRNELK